MLVLLLLSCAVYSYSFEIPKHSCGSEVTIDKDHYNVSDIYHIGDAYPTEMHYDKYGNLFFIESGQNSNGYTFDGKVVKANSSVPEKIFGLPEGQCYDIAVDKKNSKVYFGTGKGIFAYNYDSEDTKLISSPDIKPNELFVDKEGNKYITESFDGVDQMFLLSNDRKIRFKSLDAVNEISVDDNNNFYFIREEKLFVLKSNLSFPIFLSNVSYDGLAQISFNENIVYVASESLLYLHENDSGSLKPLENTPNNVTGITFDTSNNFVLGMYGKILRYQNTNNECYHRNA